MKRAPLDALVRQLALPKLADVGRKVSVGRLEFVPPRGGVDALTPGEVGGKIFGVPTTGRRCRCRSGPPCARRPCHLLIASDPACDRPQVSCSSSGAPSLAFLPGLY